MNEKNDGTMRQKLELVRSNLKQLTDCAGAGEYPPEDLIEAAQKSLREYLACLEQRKKKLAVSMQTTSERRAEASEVREELCSLPGAIPMLAEFGFRKILRPEDKSLEPEVIARMKEAEYITEISGTTSATEGYLTLTSRGWSCFRQEMVESGIYGVDSVFMLPESLSVDPNLWDQIMLRRAEILCRYYGTKGEACEYLLFPVSRNAKLLMGTEIGETAETSYSCAWVEDEMTQKEDLESLRGILAAGAVDKLVVVAAETGEMEKIRKKVRALGGNKTKVEIYALGDGNGTK